MAIDTWITRVIVMLGFVTALITLWRLLQVDKKQDEIHVLVNSRLTKVVNRVDQLTAILRAHGIDVPDEATEEQ
jgi:hypothetical protein